MTMDLIEKLSSLKWGLPKQEYREIFSDKQWLPDHPTENAVGFCDEIENRNVSVVAYFVINDEIDRLARIVARFESMETDTQRRFVFESYVDKLNKSYGNIKYSTTIQNVDTPQEYRLSELAIWETNGTIIMSGLRLSKDNCIDPGIFISFGDSQNDPVSKMWREIIDTKKS